MLPQNSFHMQFHAIVVWSCCFPLFFDFDVDLPFCNTNPATYPRLISSPSGDSSISQGALWPAHPQQELV
jgi:hypothetical protein